MAIDYTQTRVPLYFRIQQAVLDQIKEGKLKPGDQLPSEAELAQQFRVSRITAKRAMDELERLGRVFRQQGSGTYVAQPRIREISGFRSFSEDILARGMTPGSEVLAFAETEPDEPICKWLHLAQPEPVYLIKRLRLADNEPVAVETAYIPCRLAPGMLREELTNASLYAILRQKYQIIPTWADAEIEATAASKEEAYLLQIEKGKPLLAARRVTYSANYETIETVYSVYRGDRFTLYTDRQYIG